MRRPGAVQPAFASLALLALLLFIGCATTPPAAPKSSGLTRPGDARQAVVDAIARVGKFKDVSYTLDTTSNTAGQPSTITKAEAAGTRNPPMAKSKLTIRTGTTVKTVENVDNIAARVVCSSSDSGPVEHYPVPDIAADAFDPFSGFFEATSNWRFIEDANLSGHSDWRVMADLPIDKTTPSPTATRRDTNSTVIWIDAHSGKIDQRQDHSAGLAKGSKFDQTLTYANFVYDHGVTIPPCV